MASDGDRRRQPRAPIALKVEYKRLNTFFADFTRNISKGGTFIATARPLPLGTEFVFTLVVPQVEEPITLRGEVRWTLKEGEAPPPGVSADHAPGMGIRFVYGSDEERARVEATVEKLMVDSLGSRLYARLLGR